MRSPRKFRHDGSRRRFAAALRRSALATAGGGVAAPPPVLLSIDDLRVAFRLGAHDGVVRACRRSTASASVPADTTVALVGESGPGKSVTAMAVWSGLLPDNAERSGRILFEGRDLLVASKAGLRSLRGRDIGWSSRIR